MKENHLPLAYEHKHIQVLCQSPILYFTHGIVLKQNQLFKVGSYYYHWFIGSYYSVSSHFYRQYGPLIYRL